MKGIAGKVTPKTTIAIYCRVSSNRQDTRSQEVDLQAWAKQQLAGGAVVRFYREKATGTNFNRKVWEQLHSDLNTGKVSRLIVWRMDRLGRTAGQTITLLDELEAKGIGFLSLRDGFDPSTPAGRLTRNILASFAQFETEVRRERQAAGIQAAKAAGKTWGGRNKGARSKRIEVKEVAVHEMIGQGKSIAETARVLELTRQTVYRILGKWERRKSA